MALTENDFINAAAALKVEVAAIKAVATVETGGKGGFLPSGDLQILFEGHIFYKYTKGKFATSNPTLCYPKWTREFYAKGPTVEARGQGELDRLEAAMKLDQTAALMSASYGMFQIMGFNFAACGFTNVEDFFMSMQESEGNQLLAFCSYIKHTGLDDELRGKDWAGFAKYYNGPEYQKNQYDTKLAAAYKKFTTTA